MQGFRRSVAVNGCVVRKRFVDERRCERGERRLRLRFAAGIGNVMRAIVVFHGASYRERQQDAL